MDGDYRQFIAVAGALLRLVVLSMLLERGLAFVFEHDWFERLTSVEVPDPANPGKTMRKSRYPGLKGIIALALSALICFLYRFDVLSVLFAAAAVPLGMLITGLVAAGGSSGAISIFQGFLNLSKESRDAQVAARKAEAESAKYVAEIKVKVAEAEKAEAEARKKLAEASVAEAEATKKLAEAARIEAEFRKRKAEAVYGNP